MSSGETKEQTRRRFRRGKEDGIRNSLAKPPRQSSAEHCAKRPLAEQALASIDKLEIEYLAHRNPVHVWDAMMQIHFAAPVLNIPVQFPPWVLAYLITAASEIMGRAVAHPAGDRHRPKPDVKNSDGTITRYSDCFAGVTASQRRDIVLDALGFKGPKGWNPFAQAHRDEMRAIRLSRVDALRRQGHTITSAVQILDDDGQLVASSDRVRKIRRDRRRVKPRT